MFGRGSVAFGRRGYGRGCGGACLFQGWGVLGAQSRAQTKAEERIRVHRSGQVVVGVWAWFVEAGLVAIALVVVGTLAFEGRKSSGMVDLVYFVILVGELSEVRLKHVKYCEVHKN